MLRRISSLLIVLSLAVPALAQAADKPAKDADDRQLLQGIWKAVGLESGGQAAPEHAYSGTLITFDGDKFILKERGHAPNAMDVRIDPTKSPRTIDITATEGPSKGLALLGIYELSGDDLKICFSIGKARPAKLATTADEETEMFTLKRLPAEQPWKRFTAEADGYSIEMPGEPEARKRRDDSMGVAVEATIYVVRSDREPISYLAMGYKLPVRAANENELQAAMDAACKNVIAQMQGELVTDKKLAVKNGVGRELLINSIGGAQAIVSIQVQGDRMYMIQAVGTVDMTKSKSVERYLNSFKMAEAR